MMKKKITKKVTLENINENIDALAVVTKRGFDNVHSELKEFKDEMYEFKDKTERSLFDLNSHAKETNIRLDAIEKTLGPLVQVSSVVQREIRDLNMRVNRLEKLVIKK